MHIQPIADRVAKNLEIISETFSTNQPSAHGIYDQYQVIQDKSHENPGTLGTKLKVVRNHLEIQRHPICNRRYPTSGMGWLWLVGSIKLQVSFAKEPYKRDDILQKRPIILRGLLIVATPYISASLMRYITHTLHTPNTHLCLMYVQPIPLGVTFSNAVTETWQKRRSSFEL